MSDDEGDYEAVGGKLRLKGAAVSASKSSKKDKKKKVALVGCGGEGAHLWAVLAWAVDGVFRSLCGAAHGRHAAEEEGQEAEGRRRRRAAAGAFWNDGECFNVFAV